MKFEDISLRVDFLYYGEVNIHQENLDTFLNISEELELKGLKARTEAERGGEENPPENFDVSNKSIMENYTNEKSVANKHNQGLTISINHSWSIFVRSLWSILIFGWGFGFSARVLQFLKLNF